jgi:hypothetical protein
MQVFVRWLFDDTISLYVILVKLYKKIEQWCEKDLARSGGSCYLPLFSLVVYLMTMPVSQTKHRPTVER